MGIKNFSISIMKSVIVLAVATLVFSSITLDFPDLIKGMFGDIFAYASPDAQKRVVGELAETCSSLNQGENVVTINQICANRSLMDSMQKNCQNYRELRRRGIKIENEEQTRETCLQIESGEFERQCKEMQKTSLLPDFSRIGSLCKDYKAGKINDKEFFLNVIGGAIPSQMQMPNIGVLEIYNNTINYLNNNKIIYFIILAILIAGLYSLIRDNKMFLITLSNISFSIGLLITLPYFAILTYDKFVGIDTTPLLGSIIGEASFEPNAIISIILLLFLRTYNASIITIGIVLLAIGTAGKTYAILYLRPKEKEIKKKNKNMKKLVGELKESMKEKKK